MLTPHVSSVMRVHLHGLGHFIIYACWRMLLDETWFSRSRAKSVWAISSLTRASGFCFIRSSLQEERLVFVFFEVIGVQVEGWHLGFCSAPGKILGIVENESSGSAYIIVRLSKTLLCVTV